MKNRFIILALLVFAVAGMLVAPVAAGDPTPTTEVTVIKLAEDGTKIDEVPISLNTLKAGGEEFPIQGDGVTHYYHQGPVTSDPWNLAEDQSLLDMGALKGTDLKDLCEVVGMDEGDTVTVTPIDNYDPQTYPYENVYNPDPRQGKMVVTWYSNGLYVPEYYDGMRLVFFAETINADGKHVFGNQDMKDCLPDNCHYYSPGVPSSKGLSSKAVSTITVQSGDPAPEDWSITLNGSIDRTLTRDEFITLAAENYASFDHGKYGLLEGANLSAVIGLVDDDDPATVNEALATENYTITVYGEKKGEAYKSTFYSTEVTDGEKTYVLGNKFDGIELNKTEINGHVFFPLYLQGTGVDGTQRALEGISKIELDLPDQPGGDVDVLYDGEVMLTPETFTVTAYNGDVETDREVNRLTALGALDAVSEIEAFTYKVGDKDWPTLYLDDIGKYAYNRSAKDATPSYKYTWTCLLNDDTVLDGYDNNPMAVNVYELHDGDRLLFYYGDTKIENFGPEKADAIVRITVRISDGIDSLYDGGVILEEGTFDQTVNTNVYQVNNFTPLGALHAAAEAGGFDYVLTDKKMEDSGILMLNDVGEYIFKKVKDEGGKTVEQWAWTCSVDGVTLDDYGNPSTEGLNIYPLENGNDVLFYYGDIKQDGYGPEKAIAKVRIFIGGEPPVEKNWALTLKGKTSLSFTRAQFEQAVACGHVATYTNEDGEWKGVPLWYLVGAVDDEESGDHYTFNDELAAEGYSVKVTDRNRTSPYDINFPSETIARDDTYIVANTLNGEPLPELTSGGKPCWPLQMVGPDVTMGKKIGNIGTIELVGLPEPSGGWKLTLKGDIEDTFTQAFFEESVRCHGVTYTDEDGEWKGIPLWYFAGWVDDHIVHGQDAFNDDLAVDGYTVKVSAPDGFNATFDSADVAKSPNYIVANTLNGEPLAEGDFPLKLVGKNVTSGKQKVGTISEISLIGLPGGPKPGEWTLTLKGEITDTFTQSEFEAAAACPHHTVTWTDNKNREWSGIPLWSLCGWVDDYTIHGSGAFNTKLAAQGYTVIVTGSGDYSKEFSSEAVSENNDFIIANKLNGTPLTNENGYPVRLVGSALTEGSQSVASIKSIELTEFQKPTEIPTVRIVKYAEDRMTVIGEKTVDYTWMEENLKVYGDGETYYRYEGLNFPPNDPWDKDETYPHGYFKIEEQIMGTSVRDLCDLVGGMGPDTEITFAAPDGWETTLHYDNIYAPDERQGEAVLAWYSGGKGYVPDYNDGYRLFFTPEDCIFGQWDMHECIDEKYWHYNSGLPSCAGLSAKYVSEIRIYDVPEPDWNLQLEGAIDKAISKGYFESGLACTMGANHEKSYTDTKGREWSGMPLWFLLGYVDDENFHTGKSFNADLAAEGYDVHIIGRDGSETVINSRDTMYSNNYILANSLNGLHLDGDDENWPLRLVGENVSGMDTIKGVVKIAFIPSTMEDEVVAIGDIGAGENTTLDLEEGAFSAITITAAGDITDGKLAIRTPGELPNYIDTPAEKVYQYLHVVYPAPENTIDEAVITFDLPVSWLRAHGMTTGDVKLMRYTDGAWQTLTTTYVKEENGKAYFNAVTDKFCYFAVGGAAPEPKPDPKPVSRTSPSSSGSSDVSAFAASFKPDETKTFLVGETAIEKITVTAYEEVSDFLVTVKKAHLGNDVQMPDGQVYELQEVTLYHADPAALDGITLEFAVPSTWLESHDVEAGDVVMLRYVDSAWKHLDTTLVSEENDRAVYRADSPGFSYFAIATMTGGAAEPEETQPAVGAPVETPTMPVNQTADETTVPTTAPTKTPVFWGLPLIALGALLVLRRK